MKYTLVLPDNTISKSNDFTTEPPVLSPNKGRWLPDVMPTFDEVTYEAVRVEPVPPTATSIVYTIVARDLDAIRVQKSVEIEAARDIAATLDVTVNGTQWQANERSQKLLSSAITLANAGLPLPAVWRDANNNDVPITNISQLLDIAAAIALQTEAAYSKSWQKKAEIQAASQMEVLLAISWTSQ